MVAITEEEGDEEEEEGMKANRAEGTAPRGVLLRTMICCSGWGCWAVVLRMMIGFIGTPVLALTSIGAEVDKEEEEGVVEITVGVIEVVAEVETTVVATITWLAVPTAAAVVVVVVMESGAFMILMVMTFLPLTRVAPFTGRAPLAVERLTVCSWFVVPGFSCSSWPLASLSTWLFRARFASICWLMIFVVVVVVLLAVVVVVDVGVLLVLVVLAAAIGSGVTADDEDDGDDLTTTVLLATGATLG